MPKRGENIRKRKDGRWEARYIEYYSDSGKAKYCSVYGKSYCEVKAKLSEIADEKKKSEVPSNKNMRFKELLFLWLQNNKVKLRLQTYSKYLYCIENHIIPIIGNEKVNQIEATMINGFLEQKMEGGRLDGKGGLSPNSTRTMLFIVQSAICFAVSEGLRNPLKREINKPPTKKNYLEVLNTKEQESLEIYMGVEFDSAKLGILLCLHLGLRIGEICGLQWSDIDFDNCTVHIRRTVERIKNLNAQSAEPKTLLVTGDPKTSSSNRIIPVPSYLMTQILELQSDSNSVYVIEGVAYDYLDPRTVQYKFHKYLDECKIRSVNFHALRHTFATRCIEVGMDIKSLSEILGHASVNITLNTYVHSSMELKRNQLEMLSPIRGQ